MSIGAGELILGRYRAVRRLAQGGMGVVYLGRVEGAAGFSRPVVIKRIVADSENMEENKARFVREAQILSHLHHPGIVGFLDFGQEGDSYAMVLEYVHGYDLGRWVKYLQLKGEVLPWEEAVLIVIRVLEALSYAHTFCRPDGTPAGVLHRDISPGNIMIDLEGQVHLLDFGIARTMQGDADQYKTQDGVLQGKVRFLAPELFGSEPPSVASDLYACGVVLQLLVSGKLPFEADNDPQLLWKVLSEQPRPLRANRDDVPPELEAVVLQSLEKSADLRQESAATFARDLRRTLERDDADVLTDLRTRLRRHFSGDMPDLLHLDRLTDRDKTWRSAIQLESGGEAPLPALPAAPVVATTVGPTRGRIGRGRSWLHQRVHHFARDDIVERARGGHARGPERLRSARHRDAAAACQSRPGALGCGGGFGCHAAQRRSCSRDARAASARRQPFHHREEPRAGSRTSDARRGAGAAGDCAASARTSGAHSAGGHRAAPS
jgi:eukaryotic-like serine/threonine-protein kinase